MQLRFLLFVAALLATGAATPVQAATGCRGSDPGRLERRAEAALARGDWPAAAAAYACAAAASPDVDLAEKATRAAFEHGQLASAIRSARRWLVLQPEREEARRFLATSLLRSYREADATREFAAILAMAYQDRGEGYLALLSLLGSETNSTGAARVIDALAAGDGPLPEAQYARSVLWLQAEDGATALAAAQAALDLRPGWKQAQLAEARALLLLGRSDEALQKIPALANGADLGTQLGVAWLLVGAERDQEARAVFDAIKRSGRALPQALEGLGALALARHDLEEAGRDFTDLAQLSHGDPAALAGLGRIAQLQQRPAVALRYLERIQSGPRAVASQLTAYRIGVSLGAAERAELVLADFLDQAPEAAADVAIGRANQLADEGHAGQAVALMQQAAALYPDDDDLRIAEAILLERLDRVEDSIGLLRQVMARRPDDPATLNALGYTLIDRSDQWQEGDRLVRRALQLRPDSFAIMDSVGWSLYRRQQFDQAREWLQRAWERSRDPEVAAHLGAVLWAQGRQDEAQQLWKQAQEDAPDSRTLQRILQQHPG